MKKILGLSCIVALTAFWSTASTSAPLPPIPPQWMKMFARDMPLTRDETTEKVAAELVAFRQALQRTAEAKDEAGLQKFYAPDFTATHGSGHVEARQGRIARVLKGGGSETQQPVAQSLRVIGQDVAVTAQIIPFAFNDGPSGFLRIATIYNRVNGPDYAGWRIVAMQLNALDQSPPAARVPSGCEEMPIGNPLPDAKDEPRC